MVGLFKGLGIKKTRRLLYGLLALSMAAIVIPGLGGLLADRLLKDSPASFECATEILAVRSQRKALAAASMDAKAEDSTGPWLALRERSVFMRRQCVGGALGPDAVTEDELVRRAVAAYRVWLKG